ncbi:MAG: DUF5667 domain-containing protein [Candidatus Paceibacterota bacterium]|jgi:hypothetical protein
MDKILEKLNTVNTEAKKIFLTKEEKSSVRNILISYSQKSPFINEKEVKEIRQFSVLSSYSFLRNRRLAISVFVIILLVLGGGTSYAAEGSLPGDMLYSIKVNVNEKIVGLKAFTPEAKAKFNTKIIKKRLEEADKLAFNGKLNEVNKEKITKGLEKASKELDEDLSKLIDKKDFKNISDVNSVLKISLDGHKKSLEEKTKQHPISKDNIDFILKKIDEKSDENKEVKEDVDSFEEEDGFLNEINYKDDQNEIKDLEKSNLEIEKEILNITKVKDRKFIKEKVIKINKEDIKKQFENN